MPFDPTHPTTIGSTLVREILQAGERMGAYEIIDLLSFGMAGAVYQARIIATGEECTLWILPMLLGRDRDFRKRLQAILPSVAGLEHPNVLRYRRMEWEGPRCCVEFEPFAGASLERLLLDAEAWPLFDPAAAGRLLGGVLRALAVGHARSLCHHNLVPAAILVAPDGVAKVFGFGFVEALGRETYQSLASAAVPPVRTPELERTLQSTEMRAPEVQADRPSGRATDVYHFGILAYFILTGRRYSTGSPPPSQLRDGLHPNWDLLLGRCLNPDPLRRPANPTQMADWVTAIETLEPAPGSVWGNDPPAKARRRRLPLRKLIPALLAPAFVVGIAAYLGIAHLMEPGGPPLVEAAVDAAASDLELVLDPAVDATVRFKGAAEGRLGANAGRVLAALPNGGYRVTVEAPGFEPASLDLSIKGRHQRHELMLEPQTARLAIQTVPGAQVHSLGGGGRFFLGSAGPDGSLLLDGRLLAQEHTLLVTAKGYADLPLRIVLGPGENPVVEAPLALLGVPVTVLAGPAGADIEVDGVRVGKAPLRLESVLPGQPHTVRASLPGHRPREQVVATHPGEPATLDFGSLERESGSVEFDIRLALPDESGVLPTLNIDGSPVDTTRPLALPVGSYSLRVEHPDFLPAERTLSVEDRSSTRVSIELSPRPGLLVPQPEPAVALNVVVDGTALPPGDPIAVPPGRDVVVEFEARDFQPVRQVVRLAPNERRDLPLQLIRISGPEPGQYWRIPYLDEPLAWVPKGSFTMGSPRTEVENRPDESPQTRVSFSRGFWIMPYEVRQSLWTQLMPDNPSDYKGAQLPVHNVSWQDARRFCELLTEREREAGRLPAGYVYRLPTEAEWEYAARAGSNGPFAFGGTAGPANGNFSGSYPPTRGSGSVRTAGTYGPVAAGSYAPNAWGLYDMHGNVAEWCLNLFNGRLPGGSVSDWAGPSEGRDRPIRGGGWDSLAPRARSAARDRLDPGVRSASVGFRVVLAPLVEKL